MTEDTQSARVKLIQTIITRFLKEKKEIEDAARRDGKGKIPKELCSLCNHSARRVKTTICSLKPEDVQSIAPFLEWLKESRVKSLRGQFFSGVGSVEIEAEEPIGKRKPDVLEKGLYRYHFSLSELKNRPFYSGLIAKSDGVQSCPHFDPDDPRVVRIFQQEATMLRGDEKVTNSLFFCCNECAKEEETIACDRGVVKQGFIYSVYCNLNELVLEKVLREEHIDYEKGVKNADRFESIFFSSEESRMFFLRKLEILIQMGRFSQLNETIISILKPKLIVPSGKKAAILDLLPFNTDAAVFSEEGFYVYDHTKPVEESLNLMVKHTVGKLEEYTEKERGNDHDRLIKAFEKIGQELGYVPQREHGKSGLRVDCVWYDRKGKIQVAIEVETSGGWKKDLVSTWELEPKLSVIATFQKTDSIPEALVDFSLMKSIPQKLLYINMTTKNAYLFDKQEIIKQYSLKEDRDGKAMGIEEV